MGPGYLRTERLALKADFMIGIKISGIGRLRNNCRILWGFYCDCILFLSPLLRYLFCMNCASSGAAFAIGAGAESIPGGHLAPAGPGAMRCWAHCARAVRRFD
ncbi:hypothetical protein A3224_14690 [Microbulbifer thermotolerans]|uniref:Uncharacterized protein n=1 Tax=Microbulbifer thermotolerans TaxID=252514 RepID=A0A143HPK0_MICTH|nr:hypothetical protein A3224_14690 [Microbulbifer thermotolerans]